MKILYVISPFSHNLCLIYFLFILLYVPLRMLANVDRENDANNDDNGMEMSVIETLL
jgi:hypothetical protein